MWLVLAGLITGLIAVNSGLEYFRRQTLLAPGYGARVDRQLRTLALTRSVMWIFVLVLIGGGALSMYVDRQASDQKLVAAREAVWPVFEPGQILTLVPASIVGKGLTVTTTLSVEVHPFASVPTIV